MKKNIEGALVVVKTANGVPVLLRVWEIGERVIYCCSNRQYEALIQGNNAAPPIGFPKRDVFLAPEQSIIKNKNVDWDHLTNFAC